MSRQAPRPARWSANRSPTRLLDRRLDRRCRTRRRSAAGRARPGRPRTIDSRRFWATFGDVDVRRVIAGDEGEHDGAELVDVGRAEALDAVQIGGHQEGQDEGRPAVGTGRRWSPAWAAEAGLGQLLDHQRVLEQLLPVQLVDDLLGQALVAMAKAGSRPSACSAPRANGGEALRAAWRPTSAAPPACRPAASARPGSAQWRRRRWPPPRSSGSAGSAARRASIRPQIWKLIILRITMMPMPIHRALPSSSMAAQDRREQRRHVARRGSSEIERA